MSDPVHHPAHYTSHPSGVEAIQITEALGFNLGNAVKYLFRADLKGATDQDRRKAAWYLRRDAARIRAALANDPASRVLEHEPVASDLGLLLSWLRARETSRAAELDQLADAIEP